MLIKATNQPTHYIRVANRLMTQMVRRLGSYSQVVQQSFARAMEP